MLAQWNSKKVLITVRTYPTPAQRGLEVSCTAGITSDGQWIRIFPIPYRFLSSDQQFHKYQWIELKISKAPSDPRPESFKPDRDSLRVMSDPLPAASKWQARKDVVYPLKARSLCSLRAARDANSQPTLGFFKPRAISELVIEPDAPNWTSEELAKLRRHSMFDKLPTRELEKIPYKFKYRFICEEPTCTVHELMCTDWEIGEAYRNWSRRYGRNWEGKFRETFETKMIHECDTHFFVGTMHQHPANWIIIGLFYPKR